MLLGPVSFICYGAGTEWIEYCGLSQSDLMGDVVITAIKSSLPRQPGLYFKLKLVFFSPPNESFLHALFISLWKTVPRMSCMSSSSVLFINYCIEVMSRTAYKGLESRGPLCGQKQNKAQSLSQVGAAGQWHLWNCSQRACVCFLLDTVTHAKEAWGIAVQWMLGLLQFWPYS